MISNPPKLCIIGDSSVGKTCLINRLTKGYFVDQNQPTIGSNFVKRKFFIEGLTQEVQIWDTAGQEKYKSIVSMYFRNACGAIIVYDITNESTFQSLNDWIVKLKEIEPDCQFILAGNKCDLHSERKIDVEMIEKFAAKFNCEFIEVSAKTSTNVKEMFDLIVKKMYLKIKNEENENNEKNTLEINVDDKNEKSGCC